MNETNLMHGDCLELMKEIPDGSVDMILCDLPYGVTACEWDIVIPFEPLWEQYHRVCKKNAAIVLFSQLPFMIDLINSNRKEFRYEWIWKKSQGSNFLNAKKMPLKDFEDVCVFYKEQPTYNPILIPFTEETIKRNNRNHPEFLSDRETVYGNNKKLRQIDYSEKTHGFPRAIIFFKKTQNNQFKTQVFHPTQKPVALCEYLIKTYTNAGDTVLDNCMGSGTTGVACVNTGRKFIGIEKEQNYFDIATRRIAEAQKAKSETLF